MTVGEFKAWLDGYGENLRDAPTAKQWKHIQEKLGEVTDNQGWNPYPWRIDTTPWTVSTGTDAVGNWSNPTSSTISLLSGDN